MSEAAESMAADVAACLRQSDYRKVVRVDEGRTSCIRTRWDRWRAQIDEAGRDAILVDGGRAGRGSDGLYEVLSTWIDRRGKRNDSATMQLFDYLAMAMDMGCEEIEATRREELIVDALVRLAEQLAEQRPAVMVVIKPERLRAIERRALRSMMQHFLVDPLADVDPEAARAPSVGFVWGDSTTALEGLDTELVETPADRVDEVRQFLGEDRVVEQLAETTRGDRRRLEALFDGLPQTVTHLWARRVAELTPGQRQIAEYLAVADRALEVGFLDRLVEGSAVEVVRQLCERGVATRQMNDGMIKVELAGAEIADGVDEQLTDRRRRTIHQTLATAAMQRGGGDGIFVARHALAGGDQHLGIRFGLPAARSLLRRGRWDEAEQLLVELCDIDELDDEQRTRVLALSLRLAEAQSAWRQALSTVEKMTELIDDESERIRLRRRRATYLMKLGQLDEARRGFQTVLDQGPFDKRRERARAMLGMAQIHYQRGDHENTRQWADQVLELVEDTNPEEMGAVWVDAQSVLGKAALYRGDLEAARAHFESAAGRTRRLGLREKQSRAEVNLGVVAVQRRRYQKAQQRLERALRMTEMPAGTLRLNCWLNLGIVHQRRGDFSAALDNYRRSLREARRRGDEVAFEVAVHNLATLYQDMGAFEAARQLVTDVGSELADPSSGDDNPSFTGRWAAMTRAQIFLKCERPRKALEALKDAEQSLTEQKRLYGAEMRLRTARAYLQLGRIDRAEEVLEELKDERQEASSQVRVLYRYYEAAVATKNGIGPDESTWRSIIDDLESLGLFQDAAEARLELVSQLRDSGPDNSESLQWLVEGGVEALRRRAQTVPERFYADYLAIPVHRRLIETYRELSGTGLPGPLKRIEEAALRRREDNAEPSATAPDEGFEDDDRAFRRWRSRYRDIVGEDPQILQIFRVIDRIAPSETTVLLAGESGTGKELVAEAIHAQSDRKEKPFVRVNCAAFVEELLLSELFGHEKGAFTGAVESRQGRFERADGGTIFLDEIGDISPKTQVALLRVLQRGTFERVGGTEKQSVDVRVVAATNRNLDEMVREGTFRLDLYYRLKGFLIEVPPLRERRQDIPRLLEHFAGQFGADDFAPRFSKEAIQFLAQYRWPGNVRELENFVRSVLLFSEGERIELEQIAQFQEFFSDEQLDANLPPVDADVEVGRFADDVGSMERRERENTEEVLVEKIVADQRSLSRLKKRLEKKCIKAALRQTGGNITQAARILQMKRPRLSQIVNGDEELLALKQELVG